MENVTTLIMSSVRLPWRTLAINSTWGMHASNLFFSESNTTYYGAQKDQFKLLFEQDIKTKWCLLVDDDTFVNTRNMNNFLHSFDDTKPIIIGHVLSPFKCLWGGAGMILSRGAYSRIKNAWQKGQIQLRHGNEHNDVLIMRWVAQLNIRILHSNLLWGNSIPEANSFYMQMNKNIDNLEPAIKGVLTLHKMCPRNQCDLMYKIHKIINQNSSFAYKIIS